MAASFMRLAVSMVRVSVKMLEAERSRTSLRMASPEEMPLGLLTAARVG